MEIFGTVRGDLTRFQLVRVGLGPGGMVEVTGRSPEGREETHPTRLWWVEGVDSWAGFVRTLKTLPGWHPEYRELMTADLNRRRRLAAAWAESIDHGAP
jgi:hypothetical protein